MISHDHDHGSPWFLILKYEKAVLVNFDETMDFARGMKKLWTNGFHYLTNNRSAFALLKYGQSSPLLFKAFQEKNIKQGDFFAPILRFLMANVNIMAMFG